MPFEKGRSKTGGKKKGQLSPKTLLLQEMFERHTYNPVDSLLRLIPELEPRDAAKVHLELIQYLFPKIKEPIIDPVIDITPENELTLAKEAIQQILQKFPQLNE